MAVLRVYFTMFDEEKYRDLLEEVRGICGEVREHPSRVVEEFRFIEIPEPGEECRRVVGELLEKYGGRIPR